MYKNLLNTQLGFFITIIAAGERHTYIVY